MNFSKKISNRLTDIITIELNYNEDKKEILAYAIETALLFMFGLFLIILLGYFLGALVSTAIAAIFGGILRRVSGGSHFDTPLKCLVFGSIAYSSLGVLAKMIVEYDLTNKHVLFLGLFISFLLVAVLAPVDSEAKPIHSSSLKFKLKISSMVLVIIAFLLISIVDSKLVVVSVVLGVVYQSLTLLPIFNRKGGESRL